MPARATCACDASLAQSRISNVGKIRPFVAKNRLELPPDARKAELTSCNEGRVCLFITIFVAEGVEELTPSDRQFTVEPRCA